jgi:endo-1,4-beta-xylanase
MKETPHPSRSASHLLPQGEKALCRRTLLAAPFVAGALAACDRFATAEPAPVATPPLKSVAPFPVGSAVMSGQLDDPAWVALARREVNQLTPEWEMKMEYILRSPDRLTFDAPDRIAEACRASGARLHGHALIWYSQGEQAFAGFDRTHFPRAFDRYIAEVAGRYRGRVVSWDVVNEPVAEDGNGLRDSHWSRALGPDGYMIRAFEQAKLADPEAVLFLNDYNLENNPAKGATFLRTVERLLKAGAPIGGLGTQSHLDIEIPAGQITSLIRELGGFGLPVHVSELDASLRREGMGDLRSRSQRQEQQHGRVIELAEAFMALPARQRFAFTAWGLRDSDSWLRRGDRDDGRDQPLLFDDAGQAKPLTAALAGVFGRG